VAVEPEPVEEEQFDDQADTEADGAFDSAFDQGGFDDSEGGDQEEYDFDSMVLDLESAEEPAREVWPAGTYNATIESVSPDVSQAKGNPMLVWQLQVESKDGSKTRGMRYYTVLVGDGAGRTKRTIKRIAPDTDLSSFRPNDADNLFAGLPCRAVVKIGRYNGERNNNVADILAPLGDFGR
jgi:hypothetical protein